MRSAKVSATACERDLGSQGCVLTPAALCLAAAPSLKLNAITAPSWPLKRKVASNKLSPNTAQTSKGLGSSHQSGAVFGPEFTSTATTTGGASEALRLTAQDLIKLGVADRIIEEPLGGAHRDRPGTIAAVGKAVSAMLSELSAKDRGALIRDRREKFLGLGAKGLAA